MKTIIDPDKYNEMLMKWRGSLARIWIFDVSLTRLCLRLARVREPDVLYIVGASCEHIKGPFSWKESEISVLLHEKVGGRLDLVVDKPAGFELQCQGVVMVLGPAGELDKTLANFLRDDPFPQASIDF